MWAPDIRAQASVLMGAHQQNEEVLVTTQWEALFSEAGRSICGSAVRELFRVVQRPGMISFGGGLPAPETFPCEEVSQACVKVLREQGPLALQYGQTEGYNPLRDYLAEVTMAELGLFARRDNVLITTGGAQAADLLPRVLLNPGEAIVVEAPTFLGALTCFSPYRPRYISIPLDDQGMQVERLEEVLARERGVKFIYVIPSFQNPAGCTMSLQRRERLVALADACGVPILEDDPYSKLRYSGEPLPALVVLDQRRLRVTAGEEAYQVGNVVYVGSFSKILSPGMRLGWVVGPVPIVAQLALAKQGTDLHTSLLVQMIAYELCRQGFFPTHVAGIRELYRRRRDLMIRLMREHFPAGVRWTEPEGGLFLWVTLPEGVDTGAVLPEAIAEGVAFVSGRAFFAGEARSNCMRLNFSNANEEQMERGIARLGAVLRRHVSALERSSA